LAKADDRYSVDVEDYQDAFEIIGKTRAEQSDRDKKLADSAKTAFSRFLKRHAISSLESRGGAVSRAPVPAWQRPLTKEENSIVACSKPIERRRRAAEAIEWKVGRAIALLQALESVPRRQPDPTFAEIKIRLEEVIELLS
jgi:hypothetical protein